MRILLPLLTIIVLVAPGCARQLELAPAPAMQGGSNVDGLTLAQLPAPSALPHAAQAAPGSPADGFAFGDGVDPGLPRTHCGFLTASSRTRPTDHSVRLDPELVPQSQLWDDDQLSYCGYTFNLQEFTGTPELHLSWSTPPDPARLYLALSDFANDRWCWYAMPDVERLAVPELQRMLSETGELLVMVVVREDKVALSWLRWGDNCPPVAGMKLHGVVTPPGPVLIDTFWSAYDPDGELAWIWFDLDGDGVYETSNGTEAMYTAQFDTPGKYEIGVKVVDNHGVYATATRTLTVIDWQVSRLGEGYSPRCAADTTGGLHMVYSLPQTGPGEHKLQYVRWDGLTHEPQLLDLGSTELTGDIAVDTSGQAWLGGVIYGTTDTLGCFKIDAAGASAVTLPSQSIADLPYPLELEFELDSLDHPHLILGADIPPNHPIPAEEGANTLYYFAYDGANWVERLNPTSRVHFYGFALDANDVPHLALHAPQDEAQPALPWVPVYYTTDASGAWQREIISMVELNHGGLAIDSSGTLQLLGQVDYWYTRDAGGWQPGGGMPSLLDEGEEYLDQGIAARAPNETYFYLCSRAWSSAYEFPGKLQVGHLAGGQWQMQDVFVSELGYPDQAALAVSSTGTPQLVVELHLPGDHSAGHLADFTWDSRIVHLWQ